jgi:hypothetical protein
LERRAQQDERVKREFCEGEAKRSDWARAARVAAKPLVNSFRI